MPAVAGAFAAENYARYEGRMNTRDTSRSGRQRRTGAPLNPCAHVDRGSVRARLQPCRMVAVQKGVLTPEARCGTPAAEADPLSTLPARLKACPDAAESDSYPTCCRVEARVTRRKQMIGVPATRHSCRGVAGTIFSSGIEKTSVKPCQLFSPATHSKQTVDAQNKCQFFAMDFPSLMAGGSAGLKYAALQLNLKRDPSSA